jgi:L-fuconate dehydratase
VAEYVDHLHEHFLHPCELKGAAYLPPMQPGFSIEMKQSSIEQYRFVQREQTA